MTVRKRKSTGNWVCDFYHEGRRIVQTIKHARSKEQAKRAEAIIRVGYFNKAYGLEEKPKTPFHRFVQDVFLPYSKLNKASYYDDTIITRAMCEFYGATPLQDITPARVEKYKEWRSETPTKYSTLVKPRTRNPATVNRELAVLSKIFSLAVRDELIETNPCLRVAKLRGETKRERYLSPAEEDRLMAALDELDAAWVKHILIVALNTGMRKGEILRLKWFDVQIDRGLLHVPKTKNDKPRLVPINSNVRALLDSLPKTSGYVFPSPRTGGLINDIKRTFALARTKAKLQDFRFHDTRHTAATRMGAAGVDAFTLCSIFGWSDVRLALRYTHATDKLRHEAVEKLAVSGPSSDQLATDAKQPTTRPAVSA